MAVQFAAFIPLIASAVKGFTEYFTGNAMADKQFMNQKALQELQHAQNMSAMRVSNQMSIDNAKNAGLYERLSKQRAGLNLNADGGFSPVAGASALGTGLGSASAPPPMSLDFSQFASMLQNQPIIDAQARLINAEAGLKERDLKNLNEADNVYRTLSSEIEVEVEKEDGNTVKHYINIASPQAMQAYRDVKKLKSDLATYDSDEALAILHRKIAEGQYKDNTVINAFVKRPVYEQKELLSRVAKAMSEVGLNAQKVLESQENIRLMLTQEQLNKMEAKIKAHENTYLLLENVFGEGNEGILSAVTLTLGLLKDVASLGSAGAKVASVMAK